MSADNWQVGDLALCVSHGLDPKHWGSGDGGPSLGSVNVVVDVEVDGPDAWLRFADWPDFVYFSPGFRKIRPHVPDAEDRETIELMARAPVGGVDA